MAWTLSEGDGDKKVYAQFQDGAGNESAIVTDSINLNLGPVTTAGTRTRPAPGREAHPAQERCGVKTTRR